MIGPNFYALVQHVAATLVVTLPFAFLFFMFGLRIANRFVGAPRTNAQNALAVFLQWILVAPLQLILGYQLSLWNPEASEVTWIAILACAIPVGGVLAAYVMLRHQMKHCLTVGLISSSIGGVATGTTFWVISWALRKLST